MISRNAKFHISYPVWRALYLGMLTSVFSLKITTFLQFNTIPNSFILNEIRKYNFIFNQSIDLFQFLD